MGGDISLTDISNLEPTPVTSQDTFSRIDLAFARRAVLPRVTDIKILHRGTLDHALLLLSLDSSVAPADTLWRLSRFWISDDAVNGQFRGVMTGYWDINPGSAKCAGGMGRFQSIYKGTVPDHHC